MMAQAAAPPTPEPTAPAAANDPLAAPAASQAAPDAQIPSAPPATQTALQSAEPQEAAAAPPKPATATPARRPASTKAAAPQTAAMHPPPAAHGSAAGAFRVQFGAFASEENARHLQSTLEAAGLNVVVSRDQAPSGNQLFYVRSPSYPDRAVAMSAAQNMQNRAQHASNPVRIDYTIIADHAARDQHAQR
jgi:cell division septation protein DedD